MLDKLKSRKFLLALAGAVSIYLSEALGLEFDPEAIYAFGAVIASYVFGEALVDRRGVEASMKQIQLDALDTASLYARQLEAQLNQLQSLVAGDLAEIDD
jgi:hypothetical protein